MFIRFLFAFFLMAGVAQATNYETEGDLIGAIRHYTVKKDDNLYDITRKYDIGIVELLAANPGVDVWEPPVGQELILPTQHVLPAQPRKGIVINLAEMRMFFYPDETHVMSFPIGIGRDGWETPLGPTSVALKRENPTWTPPLSIREENPDLPEIVPAGPDNPLGKYALSLGKAGYAIHGTNRPYGVGKRSSHGCIRLYPEDIAVLFQHVKVGTPVVILDMPYKLGWQDGTLYLEMTTTQQQADDIADYEMPGPDLSPSIYQAIRAMTEDGRAIDWYAVDEAINIRNGIPVAITNP